MKILGIETLAGVARSLHGDRLGTRFHMKLDLSRSVGQESLFSLTSIIDGAAGPGASIFESNYSMQGYDLT